MADDYAAEKNGTPKNAVKSSVLKLDVLGTSFTITVEEDESYLSKVLTQYKAAVENTQSISGITSPLNIAILTGFLLCDEINKMKQSGEEASGKTLRLIAALDEALKACADE